MTFLVVKCLFDALRLLIEAILSREVMVYILSLHGLTQGAWLEMNTPINIRIYKKQN